MISLMVVVDEAGGMGYRGQLLCHLPADLKHFKQYTLGKPIVMGRKTFASIGRPLPDRHNVVISRQCTHLEGVTCVPSLETALQLLQDAPEVMVIGGAQIFAQALPRADRIYLTTIHHQFPADVFFPPIDRNMWQQTATEDVQDTYPITFSTWERLSLNNVPSP